MGDVAAVRRPTVVSPGETAVSRWVEIAEVSHGSMYVNLSMALSIRHDVEKQCTVLEWPNGHYVKSSEAPLVILAKKGL